ncbi:hypothetical protein ACOZ4N_07130 [Halorientalis pallida]|uniref:hypothetical protein n=1 Tax=Halorientalis pallida TaxID=2479928 RepID=UPI003C6FC716
MTRNSDDQTTNSPTTDERDDAGAQIGRALVVALRLAWVLVRLAVTGVLVAARWVTDADRRRRLHRWLLLEGDRWTIVWLLVGGIGLLCLLLCLLGVVGVARGTFVATTFGAVISGLFSFVPIVIAVNQLVVNRVFGTPEQVRSQIRDVDAFREQIERQHPSLSISPTEPAGFLQAAVEVVADRADRLEAAVADDDTEAANAARAYVAVIRRQTAEVRRRLDGTHQDLFEILPAMMGDSYSRNVNEARRLGRLDDGLSDRARERLADLEDVFVSLDVLRQYFKALYLTQELSYLSRLVGYTGVGSFVVAVFVIMAYANGQPLAGHPLLLYVLFSGAVAVVTLPFAVLLSFVLRIATIAQRTAAPGAFTPRRETPPHTTHREEGDTRSETD